MRFWRGMQIIFQPSTQTERTIVPLSSLIDGKFGQKFDFFTNKVCYANDSK